MIKRYTHLLSLCLCLGIANINAQSPSIALVNTYSGFNDPVDLTNADDGSDRLFVVERGGTIKVIDANGITLSTPFLTVSPISSGGERGLLGLAFHPDYASNGFFFVNYTINISGQLFTRIARYEVSASNPDVADANSEVVLLDISQPFNNHNAGVLNFGPDGYLYIPTGDGGSGGDPFCEAQDPLGLLGKILRLDVDQNVNTAPYFGVPASNPYVGNSSFDDKIWAIGLRNPWRTSFDRVTGDYWIADVGQNQREEISVQPANSAGGENYGWKVMEGNFCFDSDPIDTDCPSGTASCFDASYTDPIFDYTHNSSTGGFSVTGGYVYRGCNYPMLYGYYIMADYVTNHIWALDASGNIAGFFSGAGNNISTFGEDESGELYAVSLNGIIYQVTETTTFSNCNCPLDQMINGIIATGIYDAEDFISSDGIVGSSSNVHFRAGNMITLDNGFEVRLNGEFLAEIFDCSTTSPFMENPNTRQLVKEYLEQLKEINK